MPTWKNPKYNSTSSMIGGYVDTVQSYFANNWKMILGIVIVIVIIIVMFFGGLGLGKWWAGDEETPYAPGMPEQIRIEEVDPRYNSSEAAWRHNQDNAQLGIFGYPNDNELDQKALYDKPTINGYSNSAHVNRKPAGASSYTPTGKKRTADEMIQDLLMNPPTV